MRTLGIALIVLGVLMLAYQGFTYTKDKEVLDIGPIEATVEEKKTVTFPPVLGIAALGIGIVLVFRARRQA